MPRKRKKPKSKKNEKVWYEIEIEDWEVGYTFGINDGPWDLFQGDFWEHLHIDLIGKIIKPTLKNASAAKVILIPTWKLDDYYKNVHREKKPTTTGMIDLPRGSDILEFHCYFPSRPFAALSVAVAAGKIKYASIAGTKLWYRKGDIKDLHLVTNKDEDDE